MDADSLMVVLRHIWKMAFGGVRAPSGLDPNAGYLVEDESDLEFSECDDSSG